MRSAILCVLGMLAAPASAEPLRGLDPAKAVTQYAMDVWTAENGLPQNTVNAVLQTPDGYLWIGTYDGLARFDGVRFTTFGKGTTEALKDNGVRALCLDREGALFVGTNGGGLVRLAGGRFTRYSPGQGPTNEMVWALHADPEGGVFVGTNGGTLYRFHDGVFERLLASPEGDSIYAIERDRQGQLWVGSRGGGLKRRSADARWTTFTTRDGLPSDSVRAILEDHEGALWIGTLGGGVARFEGGRFTTFSRKDGLPDDVVAALHQDRNGTLWIATRRGLTRRAGGTFSTLDEAHGLPSDLVYTLYEDREGGLWVGTSVAGVARLRDGSFTTYTMREGLSDDFVAPIEQDAEGSVWVGTNRGLDRLRGGRWTHLTTRDGLCHDVVRSLWSAGSELWIGTFGGGVCRWRGGAWTRHTTREGLVHDSVRAVLGTRDGSVWVGTVGGLSRFDGKRWRSYTTRDGLPTNSILCLREDRSGRVWIGTDGAGLARYRDDGFDVYGPGDGLPSGIVLTLHEDEGDGTLWIGTSGGLARLRDGRLTAYTTRSGLPTDSVHQILDDGDGNLWIGSSRGVYRLTKRSLGDYAQGRLSLLTPLLLGRSDGMRSIQCTAPAQPAGLRTRDGRLWFATAKGIAVLDPKRLRIPDDLPPVVIESVLADQRPLEVRPKLTLEPGVTRIAFQYTGLSLLFPEKIRFRYRLQGFDTDLVEAGDRRVAYYTGLPPGEYVFEVTARLGDAAFNPKPATLALVLKPRFHQTRSFLVAVAAATLLVAVAAHRLRIARLKAHESELALLVEERTRKLSEEKLRAEDAGREAERQKRIAQEADALKTELLAIATHDLKNPLQAIMGLSEMLSAESDPRVAESSRMVHSASQRMLRLVEDLLANSALEGGIELRLAEVDVGRLAGVVLEDYRALAEAKGQSLSLAAESGCRALLDEDRMRDVIDNLVSNAVKYTESGRAIRMEVSARDGLVRLEVQDEGPGLTEDDRERLFGRFQRLSARPTAGEPSTGLGLHIVKRLVDLLGGRVWAESRGPGHGSRFVVELPQVRPAP